MRKRKKYSFSYQQYTSLDELPVWAGDVFRETRKYLTQAYAPYSSFRVACCVYLKDGTRVFGTNQENIAYPSGLCAERVALFYAHSEYPRHNIKALFVVAQSSSNRTAKGFFSPCGSCRQVMAEARRRQKDPFALYLWQYDGTIVVLNDAMDLLPLSFVF